jgi:hypothetical protein
MPSGLGGLKTINCGQINFAYHSLRRRKLIIHLLHATIIG